MAVIEHFDKPVAESLLTQVEQAFQFVVISTPRGFMPHDGTVYPSLVNVPLMSLPFCTTVNFESSGPI